MLLFLLLPAIYSKMTTTNSPQQLSPGALPKPMDVERPIGQSSLQGLRALRQVRVSGLAPTPLKINVERNHGGSEDDFPFQMDDL